MKEGELVEVTLAVRVPVKATHDQVDEWLHFVCGDNGSISSGNPLVHEELEPWGASGIEWRVTGYVGVREEYDHEERPDGRYYKVRYRRVRIEEAA